MRTAVRRRSQVDRAIFRLLQQKLALCSFRISSVYVQKGCDFMLSLQPLFGHEGPLGNNDTSGSEPGIVGGICENQILPARRDAFGVGAFILRKHLFANRFGATTTQ